MEPSLPSGPDELQPDPLGEDEQAVDQDIVDRLDRLWPSMPLNKTAQSASSRSIGKYQLQRIIGSGSFGVVYLAFDTVLDRQVALKLPRLEVLLDKNKRDRFNLEAELAASLEHPGIIRVYEADLIGPEPFIAMAYGDGPNLAEWMTANSQKHSWQSLTALVAEIALSVDHAHQQGILHRDLKPANILMIHRTAPVALQLQEELSPLGRLPALTDFGLARFIGDVGSDTRSSVLLGTPLYVAPEQLLGSKAKSQCPPTAAVDIYSLGVILFELLTGQTPLDGDDYLQVIESVRKQKPLSLRKLRPDLPKSLDTICAKCLEKEPAHRYHTAAALARDLERSIHSDSIEGRLPSKRQRAAIWITAPQRIAWAGWFAITWHMIVTLWMGLALAVVPFRVTLETGEWWALAFRYGYGLVFSFSLVFFFGWWTIKKKRWAIYSGFLLSFGKTLAFANASFGKPINFYNLTKVFEDVPAYSFVDRFLFLICIMLQTFLYGCAIAAQRKHKVCD